MDDRILDFVKSCVRRRRIYWTYHVNMRLKGRSIRREKIISSLETYEIIEEYPEDRCLPSYLIYAEYDKEVIHVQMGIDLENDSVTIITAYKPSFEKWEKDLKTRRKNEL